MPLLQKLNPGWSSRLELNKADGALPAADANALPPGLAVSSAGHGRHEHGQAGTAAAVAVAARDDDGFHVFADRLSALI
ncbi:MAG: hypothetical protein OXC84_05855 [Gammaproteobacteria bacterium]|nr:hypothetical protein [Gammaproteobacteria bacterium]